MRRLCPALLLALAAPVPVRAGPRPATVDDYFSLATPLEAAVSPDLRRVAYAEARWRESTDDRKADAWVVPAEGGKPRRLTFDRVGARSLRWAADGNLYYVGARRRAGEKEPPYDGKPQVWRVNPYGGRSAAVTRAAGGVAAYDLDPAGAALYYVVNVPAELDGDFVDLKKGTKGVEYGDGGREKSQLWRLDLEGWREEKLRDDGRTIRELSVAPGGKALALITTPDDTVVSFEGRSRVEVLELATGKTTVLPDRAFRADAASPFGWLEHLRCGPGGRLAFNVIFDGYPAEVIVGARGTDGWSTWKVARPGGTHVKGYGSPLAWGPGGRLYFLGEKKARVGLCEVDTAEAGARAAWTELPGGGELIVSGLEAARNDKRFRLALLAGSPTAFREVHLWDGKGEPRRLTRLNPQADGWELPKVSVVSWKGAGGAEVHGVLELPAGAKPGEPLPLVVAIHGGPTTAVTAEREFNPYEGRIYLPARGYAVLCPNYRGSTGNGDKFLTDLIGRENDLDVGDILAGVDAMVERKIADPKRLAVMGWSNGGYLTNCILTKTDRFRAASSGAGIVDTVMEWGANDEPAYMNVFKRGLPWDRPDAYRRTSPTYRLDRVRTPTLIHVGGNDVRCPPAHSRMLYRALSLYNKVPTELVTYTGEPHGLTKYANRRAKMAWDVAWFDRYVLGVKAKR